MALSSGSLILGSDVSPVEAELGFNSLKTGEYARAWLQEGKKAGDYLLASNLSADVVLHQGDGGNPPASGTTYTWTPTINSSIKKIQWEGTVSGTSDANQVSGGFWIYSRPNTAIEITWSGNAGNSRSEIAVQDYTTTSSGSVRYIVRLTSAVTDRVTTFTSTIGRSYIGFFIYSTSIHTRWISISKIKINNVQVFPI